MTGKIIGLIIGIVFVIGGLTGGLVLVGTTSGVALAAVGAVIVIWNVVGIVRYRNQQK